MSLVTDLVVLLKARASVANLCVLNAKTNTRAIRPDKLSQDDVFSSSLGAIEVKTPGSNPANALDGSTGCSQIKIEIDCVSLSRLTSDTICDAVSAYLEPFSGATATGKIGAVDLVDRLESWYSREDGSENGEYVTTLILQIIYTRN